MDASRLRAAQAPLKERYREDPGSARTPLTATGRIGSPGVTFDVDQFAGVSRAGLHRATGGDGSDACSGDMLLEALLACAGVTLNSVATASGIRLDAVDGRAEGYFDARGTLGVDREAPVGVQHVTITFTVDTGADEAALARLAKLTERYCVVGRSLAEPPEIVVRRR
ncbi:OsmC family protein [Nocardia thailandica]|uniref:OsmC family protein n=1 Tax=Nocardia thailandica TaxID=257275 RepID=UPI0003201045|nr:OsmC family protein [Nocardia thailandica]